jgi:uncharacterized protein (TIGR02599 family)
MQYIQPTENLSVYDYSLPSSDASYDSNPNDWFVKPIVSSHATNVRIVADNIIALYIWPKSSDTSTDALAPNYTYDSRLAAQSTGSPWQPASGTQPPQMNQIAPILRVAMVALDEPSAKALQATNGSPTQPPVQLLPYLGADSATAATNPNANPPAKMFTNPANMDADLAYLQTQLAGIKPHISFRVFDTTIAVRSAKFSK